MLSAGDTGGLGLGSQIDGKYSLVQKLSEGSGGVVWLASDAHGNDLALKTLKWSPLKSRELATERFKNEFAIFKTLSHPNIARIYDFGFDPSHNVYYFTSELLPAGDLRALLKQPVDKIESMLLQALRSLEYLRNSGLLHLDIKPQNFLLRELGDDHQIVLIDFGLATFRPPDKPGGTANYMPPEIVVRRFPEDTTVANMPEPDHRSDLYSLGVTFYYILTGVQPFAVIDENTGRLNADATLKQHLEFKNPPPPSHYRSDIPHYLDTIIMKLMAFHPDDRYPAAAVAAQALRYRSPRELEPENIESLLSYLPKKGKMIGRKRELEIARSAITAVAKLTPHAPPILCVAGGRGSGRTRFLEYLKPLAQRLEMHTHLITTQNGSSDELSALSVGGIVDPRPQAILIDDLDAALENDEVISRSSAFLTPFKELVHRVQRTQRISHQTALPMFIAFSVDTDRVPLNKVVESLDIDRHAMITIELKNFTTDEVHEYLGSLLGEEPSHEATTALHSTTQGNPLFVTEQMEQMIADGHLFSLAGRPDASTLEAIGLDFRRLPPPRSLTDATIELLKKLPPVVQHLAALISCWSETVGIEELRETFDLSGLESSLIHLVSVDMIYKVHDDGGRYAFRNHLVASIVESHLPDDVRTDLHTKIAHYLERVHTKDRLRIDRHRARSANASLRLRALERLSKDAEDNYRPHEAAEHLEALLRETPSTAWDMRSDVTIRLGRAYDRAYMPEQSSEAFHRLMNLGAPGDKQRYFNVRALEQLALAAIRRRELDEARKHLSDAIDALGKRPSDLALRLRLENYMAGIDLRDGKPFAAVERFSETAKRTRGLPPSEQYSLTNNELGEALLQAERFEEAEGILSRELEEATAAADHDRICARHYLLGNLLSSPKIARFNDALVHYDKAFEMAKRHRLLRLQVRLHNSLGNLKLQTGNLDEAIANYRKGLALSEQIDSKTTSVELMVGLGLAHSRLGEIDSAIEYFEAALDFASGPKGMYAGIIKRFEPTIYVHLGDAYYRKHEYDRATGYLEKAQALDNEAKLADDVRYSIYGTFAEIYVEQGEFKKARAYLPTLEEIAARFPDARDHLNQITQKLSEHSSDHSSD